MEFLKKLRNGIRLGALALGAYWLSVAGIGAQTAGLGYADGNEIGRVQVTPPPPKKLNPDR